MGLLDDLRNQQLQDDSLGEETLQQDSFCEERIRRGWTGTIPDELAEQIADNIFRFMVGQAEVYTKQRRFQCDKGFLGKKSYRYIICFFNGVQRLRVYTSKVNDILPDPDFYSITPENNGYLYMFGELPDEGPEFCSIICGNLENVKMVLALAAAKLSDEGLNCVCKLAKEYSVDDYIVTEIDFHVDIPCDEDGVIIT